MASKRHLSISSTPSQQPDSCTTATQADNSSKPNICLICGDKARVINYGTLSCQSCKTFFRRNGFRPESVRPCDLNRRCEINMHTRHNCTACRLAKCLSMNMSSNLIRKEEYKKSKQVLATKPSNNEHVTSGKITTASQQSTLDFLQDNQANLLSSEWTLLANIIHAHDTFSTISEVQRTINKLYTLPVEVHIDMIDPREMIDQMCTSMQSFITSSPDFRVLTHSEQTSLFERNLHSVIGFYSTLFFRQTRILHSPEYLKAFITLYGSEMMLSAKHVSEQLDSDSTMIKIILIIFAFSSNCLVTNIGGRMEHDSLLFGTFRLLGSQNVYVELLWKYMIYHYGYNAAALRFSRLIQMFLCVIKTLAMAETNNETHREIVDDADDKMKRMLVITENEQTPLWGKDLII